MISRDSKNQTFWSGSQVVPHLLLSRSWMLFALEKLAAAAALVLALPSHITQWDQNIHEFEFVILNFYDFMKKLLLIFPRLKVLRNIIELRNPHICSQNFLSYFSGVCKVYIFLNINSYIGNFWCCLILIENSYHVEKTREVNIYSWKHVSSICVMKSLLFLQKYIRLR
mgnify:CR=1 FL=1